MIVPSQTFGRLTTVRIDRTKKGRRYWICTCSCGSETCVVDYALYGKHGTRSCGCLKHEILSAPRKHGMAHSSEYAAWQNAKNRCHNPNVSCYENYGGRGIKMCRKWRESFQAFYGDMGPCPKGYTIERKNNDIGYEPGNCIWASRKEQGHNTRRNTWLEFDGKRMILADWARLLGLRQPTICQRLKAGWSVRDALTKPLRKWPGKWK